MQGWVEPAPGNGSRMGLLGEHPHDAALCMVRSAGMRPPALTRTCVRKLAELPVLLPGSERRRGLGRRCGECAPCMRHDDQACSVAKQHPAAPAWGQAYAVHGAGWRPCMAQAAMPSCRASPKAITMQPLARGRTCRRWGAACRVFRQPTTDTLHRPAPKQTAERQCARLCGVMRAVLRDQVLPGRHQ